jgi:Transcription termination factor nusG
VGFQLLAEWHAVRLKPGAEDRARIGIEASGMPVYLPVEMIRKDYRGERAVGWRPLFPAHLFVTIDPGRDIPRLREIDGVEDLLRPGGRLAPIAGEVTRSDSLRGTAGLLNMSSTPRNRCAIGRCGGRLRRANDGIERWNKPWAIATPGDSPLESVVNSQHRD